MEVFVKNLIEVLRKYTSKVRQAIKYDIKNYTIILLVIGLSLFILVIILLSLS